MKRSRCAAVEFLERKALLSTLKAKAPPVLVSSATAAPVSQGLKITLTTDRSVYHRGQPVLMTLTETNTSNQSVDVELGPSTDGFFVTQNGRQVWASNAGVQPLFIALRTLRPGESLQLSATWNGRSNVGPASTPSGPLVVHSQVAGSPTVNIRILPA
jgi:hypothetical protein